MTSSTQIVTPDLPGAGLLIGRLVVGLGMASHGAQKLFGWFGGKGPAGTGKYMESVGYRPGRPFGTLAGLGEFGSGLLVALGWWGPIGPAMMLAVMIVAIDQNRQQGFFAVNNGVELPLLYAAGAIALAFTGFGRFSLDAALRLVGLWNLKLDLAALALAIVGGFAVLAVRRPVAAGHTSAPTGDR
jgi:putative oxidoreductase